jgi:hypothetical protein
MVVCGQQSGNGGEEILTTVFLPDVTFCRCHMWSVNLGRPRDHYWMTPGCIDTVLLRGKALVGCFGGKSLVRVSCTSCFDTGRALPILLCTYPGTWGLSSLL